MIKKVLSLICVAAVMVGVVGTVASAEIKVGMVFNIGGKGDQSFNDSAFRGLQWAAEEFGIEHIEVEPGAGADRETGLRMIASQGFDYVIGVGFLFEDGIKAVADEFPDTKFAIVDGFVPDKPNVVSLRFREHDGSFLVGVIAAMKAQADGKDTVGFVGGMDIPLIHKFEAGYKAGVEYAWADCKILSDYAGSAPSAFADPVKGKELALAQIDKGAYVIYHAAGLTGAGVYEAAKERETFIIGVDSNQNHLGYVEETGDSFGLTSMLKQVDVAVYLSIKDIIDGNFQAGVREFGLNDSVEIGGNTYRGVYFAMDEYNEDLVTQEMLDKVAEAEAKIISGEITVPAE